MKKLRIALAALLVLAMMAPMTLASAQQVQETQTTTIVGVGSYANPAQADVWELKFPTEDNLKFTVDPKMMLGQTDEYKNPDGFTFKTDATVIFENFDTDGYTRLGFSSELEKVCVENQGTTDVVVSMNIRPSDTNMILSQNGTLPTASNTTSEKEQPIIFFKAKESSEAAWTTVPAVGANFSTTVKAKSSAFNVTGDVEGGFRYERNGDVVGAEGFEWPRAQFSIQGAANKLPEAKWTDDLASPNLNITWYVRTTTTDALEIKLSDGTNSIATGTNYVMAADRKYALPGDMVTVYVQPAYPDATSPTGYVVDKGPSQINTAFMNEYSKVPTTKLDDIIMFGSGISTENHMMAYTFWVPKEGGLQGFSMKHYDATKTPKIQDSNEILIKGAPVIKKLLIAGSSG